ncbi:MAG: hypothetical protein MZV64_17040 [Ignavibacteriales bacterium]|nr:hypothetical protein [Ignavibacteriales bacterium]
MALLTLDGVTKRFGGLLANNNVSFEVVEGEILGLDRPQRRGQEHALRADHRLLPADERPDRVPGPRPGGAQARPGEPAGDRAHLPEGEAVPRHDGGRERHGRGHAVRSGSRQGPAGRHRAFLEIVELADKRDASARDAQHRRAQAPGDGPGHGRPSRDCCSSTR